METVESKAKIKLDEPRKTSFSVRPSVVKQLKQKALDADLNLSRAIEVAILQWTPAATQQTEDEARRAAASRQRLRKLETASKKDTKKA